MGRERGEAHVAVGDGATPPSPTATDRRRSFSHRRLGLYPFFLFSTIGPSSLPLVRAATCYYYTHAAVCVERPRLWSRRVRVSKFPETLFEFRPREGDAFQYQRRREVDLVDLFGALSLLVVVAIPCKTELVAGGLDSTARLTFQEASVSLSIVRSRYSVRGQSWVVEGDVEAAREKEGKKQRAALFVLREIFLPTCHHLV